MSDKPSSANSEKQTGGVTIGNVSGGIRDTIIAGRDIIFPRSDKQQRAIRDRNIMLQLVWNTWIEGVLKQSLYNEVLIELGMDTKPDAIEHPWDMVMQMPDKDPEHVAPGTTMLELFDQTNGSLLILGEPGSGKTTMLLELCRLSIERAREDPLQPIPVIFNLSSWKPEQAFAVWLVSELRDRYSVPKKIGRPWVENDELLLLLDGLDEVKEENREMCIQAINQYRAEHSVPLAVCSRRQEYEALSAQFSLRRAVLIKSLTKQQVYEYFNTAGADFTDLQQVMEQDSDLQTFAQTPLILSILLLVYQNVTEEDLKALQDADDYRKHLFNAYVSQMFKRRGIDKDYKPIKTLSWLSWLAQAMVERNQTLFTIEDIQPSWLPLSIRKRRYIFRVIFGLSMGLFIGLMFGLMFGLTQVLFFESTVWLIEGLIGGLIAGLITGLITGLKVEPADDKPTDKFIWSWKNAFEGLTCGLIFGLILLLISWLLFGLGERLIYGLLLGLVFGLMILLIDGLTGVSIDERTIPGEGIRNSWKSFLFEWLIAGLVLGLISGIAGGWLFGLIFGLLFGLAFGLINSGAFVIQHIVSKRLLYSSGYIPRKTIDFLDYCTERIFLRRVGGGYIFIHRMLMEHFAEMQIETDQ